ncbi:MAG: serine hydrolase [Candidatus Saccharimonadales bacterium]
MARRQRKLKKYLILIALAVIVAFIFWPDQGSKNSTESADQSSAEPNSKYPVIDLQPEVDAWAAKQNGTASVAIIDLNNKKTVASLNADKPYFAASLYKLYVAYLGYQKVAADGTYQMDDAYLTGYSRGKCLDEMIRNSYSPCGEKMWAELGKEASTAKLKTYGLTNTSMTGLETSAADSSKILQRLFERRDLTKAHTEAFLDSLKDQPAIYRRGLPSGISQAIVHNKVGWNELLEWHDVAIISYSNGRSYAVSVLTRSVGSSNVADLGRSLSERVR